MATFSMSLGSLSSARELLTGFAHGPGLQEFSAVGTSASLRSLPNGQPSNSGGFSKTGMRL